MYLSFFVQCGPHPAGGHADSCAPARAVLANFRLCHILLSPVGFFAPAQSAFGLCRRQILFATSQVAQIPNGSSLHPHAGADRFTVTEDVVHAGDVMVVFGDVVR